MATPRFRHTAALLPDGRVVVLGGMRNTDLQALNSGEVFDPSTQRWTVVAPMSEARGGQTATLLGDRRILVAGGYPDVASAEIYDPALNRWFPAGMMSTPRYGHTASLLTDGRVLVVGGAHGSPTMPINSAAGFEPNSGH